MNPKKGKYSNAPKRAPRGRLSSATKNGRTRRVTIEPAAKRAIFARLVQLLDESELTDAAFADRYDLTHSTPGKWRKAARARDEAMEEASLPGAELTIKICTALRIEAGWLLGLTESESPRYSGQDRSRAELEADVAEHLRRVVEMRIDLNPLSERKVPSGEDPYPNIYRLHSTPEAGASLLQAAADIAENAVREHDRYVAIVESHDMLRETLSQLNSYFAQQLADRGGDGHERRVERWARAAASYGAASLLPDPPPPDIPLAASPPFVKVYDEEKSAAARAAWRRRNPERPDGPVTSG